MSIISHPDAHQQCPNNVHYNDIIIIVFEKWERTRCVFITANHRATGFTSTLKYIVFQFFHLSTLNSNVVCSYKGFSLQIYALVRNTLLPAALNLIQVKKKKPVVVPWLHSEPKNKISIIKKQICYAEFWAVFNFCCAFSRTLDCELQAHIWNIQDRILNPRAQRNWYNQLNACW